MQSNKHKRRFASAACRKASLLALLSASSLLAGCGGGHARQTHLPPPHFASDDAKQLTDLVSKVEQDSSDSCRQQVDVAALSQKASDLIAQGRIPKRLQTPLLDGIATLTADVPACTPPAPTAKEKHPKPPHKHHGHDHHD